MSEKPSETMIEKTNEKPPEKPAPPAGPVKNYRIKAVHVAERLKLKELRERFTRSRARVLQLRDGRAVRLTRISSSITTARSSFSMSPMSWRRASSARSRSTALLRTMGARPTCSSSRCSPELPARCFISTASWSGELFLFGRQDRVHAAGREHRARILRGLDREPA